MSPETENEIKQTSNVRAALVAERDEYTNIAIMHAKNAVDWSSGVLAALIRADFWVSPMDALESLARMQISLGRIRALNTAIEMIDLAGLE